MGDGEAARMMVGGEGAEAGNQRNKAFIHERHPHEYPLVTKKKSVVHCIKEFRNTSRIPSCCYCNKLK